MRKTKTNEQITFITANGDSYQLQADPYRIVYNMTGWGAPPATIRAQSGPYQHGNSPIIIRLEPRTINLNIAYRLDCRSRWFDGRSTLLNVLGLNTTSPNAPVPGTLRWKYLIDGRPVTRDIDCFLTRGLVFEPNSGAWKNTHILESLTFEANNPIIYDPTQVTETIDTFSDTLVLPFVFPFVLGMKYGTTTITYTGSWEEFPVIEIDGPAVDVGIINWSTNKTIRLEYGISVGETVTINLLPNYKTVTNNFGDNLEQYVRESELGEWSLLYDPLLEDGENVIIVYLQGNAATTEIRFKYYKRYYGI